MYLYIIEWSLPDQLSSIIMNWWVRHPSQEAPESRGRADFRSRKSITRPPKDGFCTNSTGRFRLSKRLGSSNLWPNRIPMWMRSIAYSSRTCSRWLFNGISNTPRRRRQRPPPHDPPSPPIPIYRRRRSPPKEPCSCPPIRTCPTMRRRRCIPTRPYGRCYYPSPCVRF